MGMFGKMIGAISPLKSIFGKAGGLGTIGGTIAGSLYSQLNGDDLETTIKNSVIGAGIGLAGGMGYRGIRGIKPGIGRAKSSISQARGRMAWKGQTTPFGPMNRQHGPIQQFGMLDNPIAPSKTKLMINRAKNSFRDAVGGVMRDARMGPSQESIISGYKNSTPNIHIRGIHNI